MRPRNSYASPESLRRLYPRLKGGSVGLLAPVMTDLAVKTFGTQFVEACSWG